MKTYPDDNKRKIRKEEAHSPRLLRIGLFSGRGALALVAALLAFCMVAGSARADTVYNFTNAGATGQTGPTQAQVNSAYSGTTLAGKVTINTQGIQEWTVPSTGVYKLEAWGADGGSDDVDPNPKGGMGGYATGEVSLSAGTVLHIYVGGKGWYVDDTATTGGFNGGAGINKYGTMNSKAGTGGGASDIRLGGTALSDRIIVAGG